MLPPVNPRLQSVDINPQGDDFSTSSPLETFTSSRRGSAASVTTQSELDRLDNGTADTTSNTTSDNTSDTTSNTPSESNSDTADVIGMDGKTDGSEESSKLMLKSQLASDVPSAASSSPPNALHAPCTNITGA